MIFCSSSYNQDNQNNHYNQHNHTALGCLGQPITLIKITLHHCDLFVPFNKENHHNHIYYVALECMLLHIILLLMRYILDCFVLIVLIFLDCSTH